MQLHTKLMLSGYVLWGAGIGSLMYAVAGFSPSETPPLLLDVSVAGTAAAGVFVFLLGIRQRKAAVLYPGCTRPISPSACVGCLLCSLAMGAQLGFLTWFTRGILLLGHPIRDMMVVFGSSLALLGIGALFIRSDSRKLRLDVGRISGLPPDVLRSPTSTRALLAGVDVVAIRPPWDVVRSIGLRFFPELRLLATKEEQRAALALARRGNLPFQVAYMLLLFTGAQYVGRIAIPWMANSGGTKTVVASLSVFVVGLLICGLGLLYGLCVAEFFVLRRWMRRRLRQTLRDSGFPVCWRCGYDLRGLTSARCPECGMPHEVVAPAAANDLPRT